MSRWCDITTSFPASNDSFAVPTAPGSTPLASGGSQVRTHSVHHGDLGAAVMALEANVPLLTHDHSGAGARATNRLLGANTHQSPDTDTGSSSLHHTLGPGSFQAASGSHNHAGQYMPVETGTYARYWANVSQNIPNASDITIWFPVMSSASSLVVPYALAAGTGFNIRRAGVWTVNTTVRFFPLSSGGGETYIAIHNNGGVIGANGGSSSNAVATRSVTTTDWIAFNSNIHVGAYIAQISGTAAASTATAFGWTYCSLSWLHD